MWLILSFVDAIASGLQNAYYKKRTIQINPVLIAWSVLVVSSVLVSPLFLLGIPTLDNTFWIAIFSRLILDSLAFTLYIKAIQLSPLSVTIPIISLQPIFILISQFYINSIIPTPLGIIGVVITIFGVYYLNFDHKTKHILSPFKAIYKAKGALLMVFVTMLFSIVVSLQKLGIDNSNPYFYTAFFQVLWALFFTPIAFFIDRKGFKKILAFKKGIKLFPAGAFDAVQIFARYTAFSLNLPVYETAVGSTSILFSSFFGWLFYKEKLKNHFLPTVIIVAGIILITLAQK